MKFFNAHVTPILKNNLNIMIGMSLLSKNNKLLNSLNIEWKDTFKIFLNYSDNKDLKNQRVRLEDVPKAFYHHFIRVMEHIPGMEFPTEEFSTLMTDLVSKIKTLNETFIYSFLSKNSYRGKTIVKFFNSTLDNEVSVYISKSFAFQIILTKVRRISNVFKKNFWESDFLKIENMVLTVKNEFYDAVYDDETKESFLYFNLMRFQSIWNNYRFTEDAYNKGDLPLTMDRFFALEARRSLIV